MTEFLEPDDVDELVERKGWLYRDGGRNLLLSALAAPMPVFDEDVHPGIHRKTAVLISAVNHNHPLLDGNKRLSWYLTVAFYALSGWDLRSEAAEGDRCIRLITSGDLSLDDIELWLKKHTFPLR